MAEVPVSICFFMIFFLFSQGKLLMSILQIICASEKTRIGMVSEISTLGSMFFMSTEFFYIEDKT